MINDANSPLMQRVAAIVALSVVFQISLCLVLPYIAAHFGITLGEADRALVSQISGAIVNVFLLVVGFFFGASLGTRQKDETLNKMAATAQTAAQTARDAAHGAIAGAAPDKNVVLDQGQSAVVTAALVKPDEVTQADWDAMTNDEKSTAVATYAKPTA